MMVLVNTMMYIGKVSFKYLNISHFCGRKFCLGPMHRMIYSVRIIRVKPEPTQEYPAAEYPVQLCIIEVAVNWTIQTRMVKSPGIRCNPILKIHIHA